MKDMNSNEIVYYHIILYMPRHRPSRKNDQGLGKRGERLDEVLDDEVEEPRIEKRMKDDPIDRQNADNQELGGEKEESDGGEGGVMDQKRTVQTKESEGNGMRTYKVINGKPPVDEYVKNRDEYQVYSNFKSHYSKTLIVSSVQENSNKFYIVQLLEETKTKKYFTFYRWGRIGKQGTQKLNSFGVNLTQAITDFDAKVASKLEEGEYKEVNVSHEDEEEQEDGAKEAKMEESVKTSKTGPEVAELIKSLFSIKTFTQQVKEIGYDVKRMPLGRLSQQALKEGNDALVGLLEVVKKTEKEMKDKKKRICSLTDQFFSSIPHDFGMSHMYKNILDTKEKIDDKLVLVEMLKQIKAAKGMGNGNETGNTIDIHYRKLETTIRHLDGNNDEFRRVKRYAESTIASSHNGLKIKIESIFSLHKQCEHDNFTKEIGNNTLLWYGSRMTNFASLMSQGLQLPASDAPSSSYMFGRGVYFHDTFSKSILQCFPHLSNGVCYVLACEVALGSPNKMFHADYMASSLPLDSHSTLGCGRTGPVPEKKEEVDGVSMMVGPVGDTQYKSSMMQFNEYVVYNNNQIRMKYLIKCTTGR